MIDLFLSTLLHQATKYHQTYHCDYMTIDMPVYHSMTPYTHVTESEVQLSARPTLKLATAETIPGKAREPGWDWNDWNGSSWHNQAWVESDIKNGHGMSSAVVVSFFTFILVLLELW